MVKVQNDQARELKVFERNVGADLILHIEEETNNEDHDNELMTYQDRRKIHKKRRRLDDADYKNLDFISGSSAVVERLWSIANTIIDGDHNSTSPLLMEAFLFLCENRSYWDIQLVKEAFNVTRSQRVQLKMYDEARHVE